MINKLLQLVGNMVDEYKSQGPSFLVNSPGSPQFQTLVDHLSQITLKHVGITPDNHNDFFRKEATTYFNILEEQDFCVGVFCLGKGSSLNLHDHPNMLVVSKFLVGSVGYRSLDLVDRSHQVNLPKLLFNEEAPDVIGKKLEAVVRAEKLLNAGDINYLTPDRGNIHKFAALEDTAILDILLPNYNETDHYCNYYNEIPLDDFEENAFKQIGAQQGLANDKDLDKDVMEEAYLYKKADFGSNGHMYPVKPKRYSPPGHKTTLIYELPPMDEPITLLQYVGEEFEYQYKRKENGGAAKW